MVHQALIRFKPDEIDTQIKIFKKKLELPLIINAITGGAEGLEKINVSLARVARETGIGIAVGSQTAGIFNREVRHTYEIVRQTNPEGLVLANVSALAKPEHAREAVEMVEADMLQLHLNGVQEMLMAEGDRDFSRMEDNIGRIVETVPVGVMVKEVGFGLSRETALSLSKLGVKAIDVSGTGGTNFAGIELARNPQAGLEFLRFWGIPAAVSLLEVKSLDLPLSIMASGGISNSLQVIKALSIGADLVGIAGAFLKILLQDGEQALGNIINSMKEEIKILMMIAGAKNVLDLSTIPLVVTGNIKNWCEQRSIDTKKYGNRKV